jgi:Sulfotransferase family
VNQVPIFLLSLPRSGSTLVQRVLASHDEISTTPEPWLLLPQVYAMRERGAYAEYGQIPASRAIREFAERLPNGDEDYRQELRRFILALYARASGGSGAYFLDKTPRYHLVLDDLFRIFPDARYVFLWRNPLAIVASIVETWAQGTWKLERWRTDLFDGLANMVDGFERHAELSCSVRYEQLITDPLRAWPLIFEHLGLQFEPSILDRFARVDLEARMGDRTGSRRYDALSREPLTRWRSTIVNPMRKRWCRRYLEWIGERRLAIMGYDKSELEGELDGVPTSLRLLGSDLVRRPYWRTQTLRRETALRLLTRAPSRPRRADRREP